MKVFKYFLKLRDFLERKDAGKILGAVVICLLILSGLLSLRVGFLERENQKNLSLLNQSLPGFNNQSPARLKREINNLKAEIISLSTVFFPREKWIKENYDLSILFVEELNNTNQFLKKKAEERQLDFWDLDFPEKLPSESRAAYLLSQLYTIKEVVSLGMELGISFRSIKPEAIEEIEGVAGLLLARNYLELVCPKETLIEFIIQLNDIIPTVCLDSFLIKRLPDKTFRISLSFSNVVLDLAWEDKDIEGLPVVRLDESFSRVSGTLIPILRSKNPFFVTGPKDESLILLEAQSHGPQEPLKPAPRFFYRGDAILKTREVAVIEDTLNQETVFLGRQEKYGDFRLEDFSSEEAILEDID